MPPKASAAPVEPPVLMTKRAWVESVAARIGWRPEPRRLVEEARDPASPGHRFFDWNPGTAHEHYLLLKAAEILRRVYVRIEKSDGDKASSVRVRLFHSLPEDRARGGGIRRSIHEIVASPQLTESLLAQARRDLAAFRAKYSSLAELQPVMEAIDEVLRPPATGTSF